jgi:hypothetical protein
MTEELTQWVSASYSRAVATLGPLGFRVKLAPPDRPGAGRVIEVDGEHVLGNFVVWPDGVTEGSLIDVFTEQLEFFDCPTAAGLSELDDRFLVFLDACVKAEKPGP